MAGEPACSLWPHFLPTTVCLAVSDIYTRSRCSLLESDVHFRTALRRTTAGQACCAEDARMWRCEAADLYALPANVSAIYMSGKVLCKRNDQSFVIIITSHKLVRDASRPARRLCSPNWKCIHDFSRLKRWTHVAPHHRADVSKKA